MNLKQKQTNKKHKTRDSKFWMSIFLLTIMILSIAGFAIIGSKNTNSRNKNNQNFPLQENAFKTQSGQTYWGAVINSEKFIFFNGIEGFDNLTNIENLANKIKEKEFINIYVEPNFKDLDSIYLIEKSLKSQKILYSFSNSTNCQKNDLILTKNISKYNLNNCLVFDLKNNSYNKAEALTYHLIK